MNRLQTTYQKEVAPQLQKEFKLANVFMVPKIQKIVVNMGVADPQDPRTRRQALENIIEQFRVITGQTPQMTHAKKAIAGFKLRAGDPMGVAVTLRGEKMWQFLDKLITIVLPRVKDFRGVSRTAFDGQGNYSLGLHEQIVFSELSYDQIERIRGLQINIVTNCGSNDQAFRLLQLIGIPFTKEEN